MATRPTQVLVAGASEKVLRRLYEVVDALDGYSAVRASTIAEVTARLATADAAVVGLKYPDSHGAAPTLDEICRAAAPRAVPVVVVLDDVNSEDSARVWMYEQCVRGILFPENLDAEHVSRLLLPADPAPGPPRQWQPHGRPYWARDPAIDAISQKIDQLLESNRETRIQLAQHMHRITKVEDNSARRDVQVERLVRAFRGALRRLKKIDAVVSGDPATGGRSLAVRIDDLEKARERDRQDAETRKSWGVQIVSQVLPLVLSGLGAFATAWLAYQLKSGR